MVYEIKVTDTFSKQFKKHDRDGEFVSALDKKIEKLKINPLDLGGFLSGKLHGYKSTRIVRKFRLIFRIDELSRIVYLSAIDHRKIVYRDSVDF